MICQRQRGQHVMIITCVRVVKRSWSTRRLVTYIGDLGVPSGDSVDDYKGRETSTLFPLHLLGIQRVLVHPCFTSVPSLGPSDRYLGCMNRWPVKSERCTLDLSGVQDDKSGDGVVTSREASRHPTGSRTTLSFPFTFPRGQRLPRGSKVTSSLSIRPTR